MTDVLIDHTVLAERYLAVWNETDPSARRRAIDDLYAPDARYVDPLADARGRESIDATVAAVQAQLPGLVFRLAGPVDGHHDVARFTWEVVPAGAPADATAPLVGFDVIAVDGQGRLRAVAGFLDRVPAA
ncbi:nuclear transport factor 2 family protein [Geodermatophilus sabuli]|uniref:Nuclear transport factor 2 family protein n=1 Tax=Geodermatophilus sabuli TaxID=1564158 RepID=A0A7K3W6I6_9ACTN|nr:nuclear transport factor 2 family protein [Geodermatophilus sabuli]NEK59447.1 nuclear transport factor 2 family protein [Geodermatophilus sabuli]